MSTLIPPALLVFGVHLLVSVVPMNASGSNLSPSDQWVATDAVGRTLPSFEEVGELRSDRKVGVFYYVWLGHHTPGVHDISQILKQSPSSWGPLHHFHFWAEPEYGYFRSDDPWVIRKDLQMLSQAKVDFLFFDFTNAVTYFPTVLSLCDVSMQMRAQGIDTPEIAFLTNSSSGLTVNAIHDAIYAPGHCADLWFDWDGKPLILGDRNDPALRSDVRDFFTFRRSWVGEPNAISEENHWPWLVWTPQGWGWSGSDANREQVSVSVAFHPANPRGQSWTVATGQPPVSSDYLTEFTGWGLHAQEQWDRALDVDPSVIMVTQWNEWLAQRFIWDRGPGEYGGRPIQDGDSHFVDVFSQEFNRDMAPMKGGHTDNMYYQLVANVRRYKGMVRPEPVSPSATIQIDGQFEDWVDIEPVYSDPLGDTMHRNWESYAPGTTLVNTTGRNDFVAFRVTHDSRNVYFYARTAEPITPHTDFHWMMLFIDADRTAHTGFEGYDYLLQHEVVDAQVSIIKQWRDGEWVVVGDVAYRYAENELELAVPREQIGMIDNTVGFYFKWADNVGSVLDFSTFFTDGDVAPDRRFNYVYENTGAPFAQPDNTDTADFPDGENGSGSDTAGRDTAESDTSTARDTDPIADDDDTPYVSDETEVSGSSCGCRIFGTIHPRGRILRLLTGVLLSP